MCSSVKRIFISLLCVFLLAGCTTAVQEAPVVEGKNEYVKSVWITYYEIESLTDSKTKSEFEKSFDIVIKHLKECGFNTITVQVRAFADAIYSSAYFPKSRYVKTIEDFDVLDVICNIANSNDISVEAWINPYRCSKDNDIARNWDNTTNIYTDKSGVYLNPASKDVNDLIVNGVREIVSNYSISAIHFDDYFYPTTSKKIDAKEYDQYINSGGDKKLYDWRRSIITNMLVSVRKIIKNNNANIKFGVSPNANINEDYHNLYADVEDWITRDDVVDYICPQIYYGFKNETMPFMFTTKKWLELSCVDMYVGLPMYKCGKADKYAGEIGRNEFKNDDIIPRQIEYISKISKIKGIYIFSLSSLDNREELIAKLKEI